MIAAVWRWGTLALVVTAAGMLASCDRINGSHKAAEGPATDDAPLSGTVTVDGSATVYPLSQAMADAFRKTNPGVQTALGFSGTGGGFKKFCAGDVDIVGASRPIKTDESEACKARHVDFIEVPVAFDSLAVVVNSKNEFVECLTVNELKAMWEPAAEGKVRTWQQIRGSFPARPLVLLGPGRESGTFDYFTRAIVGEEASSRSDYTKSEDDMVIERGVVAQRDALGYFGYAYYKAHANELKVVGIDDGRGCVSPSPETVADETYQPLTRPLFLYVSLGAAARPEVKAFIRLYLALESRDIVTKVGYVPLPIVALFAQASRFEKGVTGSALGGRGSVIGVALHAFDDEEKDRERVRNLLVQ